MRLSDDGDGQGDLVIVVGAGVRVWGRQGAGQACSVASMRRVRQSGSGVRGRESLWRNGTGLWVGEERWGRLGKGVDNPNCITLQPPRPTHPPPQVSWWGGGVEFLDVSPARHVDDVGVINDDLFIRSHPGYGWAPRLSGKTWIVSRRRPIMIIHAKIRTSHVSMMSLRATFRVGSAGEGIAHGRRVSTV